MRKLVVILALALMAGACSDKNEDADQNKNKVWNPDAMISLRMAKGGVATANNTDNANIADNTNTANITENPAESRTATHLTALEIVQQVNNLSFYNFKDDPAADDDCVVGFAYTQRDYVNERLMLWADYIINPVDGALVVDFICGEDMILNRITDEQKWTMDTIAYIKNASLRTAEAAIRKAHAEKDYATVYKLFDEAFTFVRVACAEGQERELTTVLIEDKETI